MEINENSWTLDGTTAKYGTASKTLVTVKGLESLDGLNLKGKVVTVSKASLGTNKVTITGDGYTLALADDVKAPTTKKAAWSYSGSTAIYKSSYKTAGYKLASNATLISYTAATTVSTLASIKGAASTTGLTINNTTKKITLKSAALSNKVTIAGAYEFDFNANYQNATITGSAKADTITARGKKLSINGGKGDDMIKMLGTTTTVKGGAGADVFFYQAGKNVISDYAEEDTISIASGTAITSTNGEHTYSTESAVTLPKNYKDDLYTFSEGSLSLDASAVTHNLIIKGNKEANNIIGTKGDDTIDGASATNIIDGGNGNDCIIGGAGNDTLTGGGGADIFVWKKGDGNDLIIDYEDEDTIQIMGDTVKTITASTNKEDIIFTLASKSKITLTGGADKLISYSDDKVAESIHSHFVTYNASGKSAKLKSGYPGKSFEPSNYSKYPDLATINATAVTHAMNIVGNDSANSIMGTADEDTIDGGANNDLFVYDSGNDTISGYERGIDKIMILSNEQPVLAGTPLSNDAVFNVNGGQIVVENGSHTTIEFVKSNGKHLYTHVPSS